MKIVISPAKNMKIDNDFIVPKQIPVYIEKTKFLYQLIKQLNYEQLKKVLDANDKIVLTHYQNYQNFDFEKDLTPAILSYQGIQYTYMSPLTFNDDQWDYVKKHLFILSGFYGVVNAMDGIKPYRLEMLSSFKTNYFSSLYDFWKDDFYQYLYQNDHLILNLCSDEYSKTLIPFIKPNQELINVSFYEESQGKRKQKTVYLKMARGSMVRYLAQINAQTVEDVKKFTMLGYQYDEKNSTNNHLIFIRKEKKKC